MNILALDTSTPYAHISLYCSQKEEIQSVSTKNTNSHNEELSLRIAELLLKMQIQYSDLSEVVIGSGPGSFTGLRIGYSFAKGLCSALKIPLRSLCSFQASARSYEKNLQQNETLYVIGDARRKEMYLSIHEKNENKLVLKQDVAIISEVELMKKVEEKSEAGLHILELQEGLYKHAQIANKNFAITEGLISIAREEGEKTTPFRYELLASSKPHYVRAVAAQTIEERLKKP